MSTLNFSDPEIAAQLNVIIRKMVQSEIEKSRPAPRYAVIDSINLEQKYCMVTYNGEDVSVRVPFNSVIPNEVGQQVRIEGTAGDRYITAIRGTSKGEQDINNANAAAAGAQASADSAAAAAEAASNQVGNLEQSVFVRTTRPFYRGLNPTGESSFDYQLLTAPASHQHVLSIATDGSHTGHEGSTGTKGDHNHAGSSIAPTGTSTITATASLLPMAFIKCELANNKEVLYFKCFRTSNLTTVYADIYTMNEDGTWAWQSTTNNFALEVGLTMGWFVLPTSVYESSKSDVIGVQFRVVGSGSLTFEGRDFPVENYPDIVRPLNVAMIRTTNSAPTTITKAEADSRYSYKLIYVEYGTLTLPEVEPADYFDSFVSNTIADWPFAFTAGSGGENLNISNGAMRNPSNQFLAQTSARLYKKQINTDTFECTWTMNVDTAARDGGVIIASNNSLTNAVSVSVLSDQVIIGSFTSSFSLNPVTRASASIDGNSNIRFRVTFSIADNTYRLYKNGSATPILVWPDNSGIIFHGKSQRYGGLFLEHSSFASTGPILDWSMKDIPVSEV